MTNPTRQDLAAIDTAFAAARDNPTARVFTNADVWQFILAEREANAKVADKQAWAHGGEYFDGPELNSAAIATAIRARTEGEG